MFPRTQSLPEYPQDFSLIFTITFECFIKKHCCKTIPKTIDFRCKTIFKKMSRNILSKALKLNISQRLIIFHKRYF